MSRFSRRTNIRIALALGVGAAIGALALSPWFRSGDDVVPPRPEAVAIVVTPDVSSDEPMPRITPPELEVREAPHPATREIGIRVPPRPVLRLAELAGPERYREPLPMIEAPVLLEPAAAPRPWCRWMEGELALNLDLAKS